MAGNLVDVSGYGVSCSSDEAVECFNKGVAAYASLNGNCMTLFNKALELDPDFLLLHCVLVSIAVE